MIGPDRSRAPWPLTNRWSALLHRLLERYSGRSFWLWTVRSCDSALFRVGREGLRGQLDRLPPTHQLSMAKAPSLSLSP